MRSLILDTNAYSGFLSGDPAILDALGEAESVKMSVVVLGELFAGFRGGRRRSQNLRYLNSFLAKRSVEVLDISRETSEVFGQIKYSLKEAGTPIPINDVWIAAQALETGSILATFDRHFAKVPGVRLWEAPG